MCWNLGETEAAEHYFEQALEFIRGASDAANFSNAFVADVKAASDAAQEARVASARAVDRAYAALPKQRASVAARRSVPSRRLAYDVPRQRPHPRCTRIQMKQATTAPSRQAMTSGKDDSKGIAEDP